MLARMAAGAATQATNPTHRLASTQSARSARNRSNAASPALRRGSNPRPPSDRIPFPTCDPASPRQGRGALRPLTSEPNRKRTFMTLRPLGLAATSATSWSFTRRSLAMLTLATLASLATMCPVGAQEKAAEEPAAAAPANLPAAAGDRQASGGGSPRGAGRRSTRWIGRTGAARSRTRPRPRRTSSRSGIPREATRAISSGSVPTSARAPRRSCCAASSTCTVRDKPGTVDEGEKVVCVDAATGEQKWERRLDVYLTDVPDTRLGWSNVVGDPETGYIYAQGVGGLFACIDGESGKSRLVAQPGRAVRHDHHLRRSHEQPDHLRRPGADQRHLGRLGRHARVRRAGSAGASLHGVRQEDGRVALAHRDDAFRRPIPITARRWRRSSAARRS